MTGPVDQLRKILCEVASLQTTPDKAQRWIEQNYVRADTEKRYILTDAAAMAAYGTIQDTPVQLAAVGVSEGAVVLDLPTNPADCDCHDSGHPRETDNKEN